MIEIKDISRFYGKTAVLQHIDLSVDKGKCLVLMGPSGSGKTSLLRIIAGLDRPDTGEIVLSARSVSTPRRVTGPESRNMSMIFQSLALWPHMTALAHILFVLRQPGESSKNQKKEKAQDLLRSVRLDGRENRYPFELSGGERQRLAIARALASRPDFLLMDEPFSNLDEPLKEELMHLTLHEKAVRNMTVIYVTHNVDEALNTADAIAVLGQGKIRKSWSESQVRDVDKAKILEQLKKDGQ